MEFWEILLLLGVFGILMGFVYLFQRFIVSANPDDISKEASVVRQEHAESKGVASVVSRLSDDQLDCTESEKRFPGAIEEAFETRLQELISDRIVHLINEDFVAILELSEALELLKNKGFWTSPDFPSETYDLDKIRHHIQSVSGYAFFKPIRLEGRINPEEIYVSKNGFAKLEQGEDIHDLVDHYHQIAIKEEHEREQAFHTDMARSEMNMRNR